MMIKLLFHHNLCITMSLHPGLGIMSNILNNENEANKHSGNKRSFFKIMSFQFHMEVLVPMI